MGTLLTTVCASVKPLEGIDVEQAWSSPSAEHCTVVEEAGGSRVSQYSKALNSSYLITKISEDLQTLPWWWYPRDLGMMVGTLPVLGDQLLNKHRGNGFIPVVCVYHLQIISFEVTLMNMDAPRKASCPKCRFTNSANSLFLNKAVRIRRTRDCVVETYSHPRRTIWIRPDLAAIIVEVCAYTRNIAHVSGNLSLKVRAANVASAPPSEWPTVTSLYCWWRCSCTFTISITSAATEIQLWGVVFR